MVIAECRANDRKGQELAMSVKAVFEGALMLELYPRCQIDIYLHVIQVRLLSSCEMLYRNDLRFISRHRGRLVAASG